MSLNQQLERWKIFQSQVEKATIEGLILCLGDMNIDLKKWEDTTYYQKKIAGEYQLMIGEYGLKLLNFGTTWSRQIKDTNVESALDHAFTNKPLSVDNYFKNMIGYSDHSLICVDLKWDIPKP